MIMRHISITPFGRQPVTAGLLATQALSEAPAPAQIPDKWALLRDLTAARVSHGVSDRDLAVLSALLSFHPDRELADDDRLIVFPSNAALSERTHGMAESTLRRHLAALVRAGLVARRDSPNGKRYATRDSAGALDRVYGFDLRPLLVLSPRIAAKAAEVRAAELAQRRLRESVVIRLRDAAKLLAWIEERRGACSGLADSLGAVHRGLRRKLDAEALRELGKILETARGRIDQLIAVKTEKMSGNAPENERHYQNSKPEPQESELCQERQRAQPAPAEPTPRDEPPLPLALVLKAAPDILDYAPGGVTSWQQLVAVAGFVRPMLGISPDAWTRACAAMGDATAAITLACILQRAADILRPGGYLRALTDKAEGAGFSPGPMVMALLRTDNSRPI